MWPWLREYSVALSTKRREDLPLKDDEAFEREWRRWKCFRRFLKDEDKLGTEHSSMRSKAPQGL